jgi:hypothetical protein
METDILFYLTVPPALLIILILLYELKIFRMAIVVVIAAIVALFDRLDKKYNQAAKEIENI